jgi:predicted transcriptional regulator
MSVTTVRLQPDIEQSLQAIAAVMQRSKSWVINQAVKEFVEKQALEQERWQETLKAMASVA